MASERVKGKDWLYIEAWMPGKGRRRVGLGFPNRMGESQVNSADALPVVPPNGQDRDSSSGGSDSTICDARMILIRMI